MAVGQGTINRETDHGGDCGMFERFKRGGTERSGGTAVADRPAARTTNGDRTAIDERDRTTPAPGDRMHAVRARQREEYGGVNWGAAFFGWLVAVGLGAILVGLLAAAGAAVGLTTSDATDASGEIGIGGGIALLIVLAIAYYAGGYVAGRMSRFDGGRQGLGAWLIGLIVTIVLAVAGAVLGSEYNVLEQLELPALPVGDSELATGGAIALILAVVVTLVAAMGGGKAGERYHRKIDRTGFGA
jgi:hypothetical protein